MDKKEAIKWIVETKAISAFTRNFVEWLYNNGGKIISKTEIDAIDIYKKQIERLYALEVKRS